MSTTGKEYSDMAKKGFAELAEGLKLYQSFFNRRIDLLLRTAAVLSL